MSALNCLKRLHLSFLFHLEVVEVSTCLGPSTNSMKPIEIRSSTRMVKSINDTYNIQIHMLNIIKLCQYVGKFIKFHHINSSHAFQCFFVDMLDMCLKPGQCNCMRNAMMSILKELDESHCQCPYGAAGKEARASQIDFGGPIVLTNLCFHDSAIKPPVAHVKGSFVFHVAVHVLNHV